MALEKQDRKTNAIGYLSRHLPALISLPVLMIILFSQVAFLQVLTYWLLASQYLLLISFVEKNKGNISISLFFKTVDKRSVLTWEGGWKFLKGFSRQGQLKFSWFQEYLFKDGSQEREELF